MHPCQLHSAKTILTKAMRGGYGVGGFNCRYPVMIPAVLAAAQAERSPVIVQISQMELAWLGLEPDDFLDEVRQSASDLSITVPFAVHLDHGWELDVVEQAVKAGFSSVMLDTSSRPLRQNIEATRDVVEIAHADGVAVEAELGHVDGAQRSVKAGSEGLYTDPAAAAVFVKETKCDFLAVSVGTSHGVYRQAAPCIDCTLAGELSRRTGVPLVLHDAVDVDMAALASAVALPEGGICKVAVDAELELVVLHTLGVENRLTMEQMVNLSTSDRERVHAALVTAIQEKMRYLLASSGKA